MPCKTENLVNRKLYTQCHHFLPGFGDNLICIAGSQGVYHIANPVADKFKLPLFETARCARRRSDANAEVTFGGIGSNGMAFLLQVICAASKAFSVTSPVKPFGRKSTSSKCVSVPPETKSKPRFFQRFAQNFGFLTT